MDMFTKDDARFGDKAAAPSSERFREMGRSIAGGAAFWAARGLPQARRLKHTRKKQPLRSRRPHMEGFFAIKCRNCGGPMYSHQQTRSFDCA